MGNMGGMFLLHILDLMVEILSDLAIELTTSRIIDFMNLKYIPQKKTPVYRNYILT